MAHGALAEDCPASEHPLLRDSTVNFTDLLPGKAFFATVTLDEDRSIYGITPPSERPGTPTAITMPPPATTTTATNHALGRDQFRLLRYPSESYAPSRAESQLSDGSTIPVRQTIGNNARIRHRVSTFTSPRDNDETNRRRSMTAGNHAGPSNVHIQSLQPTVEDHPGSTSGDSQYRQPTVGGYADSMNGSSGLLSHQPSYRGGEDNLIYESINAEDSFVTNHSPFRAEMNGEQWRQQGEQQQQLNDRRHETHIDWGKLTKQSMHTFVLANGSRTKIRQVDLMMRTLPTTAFPSDMNFIRHRTILHKI